VSETFLVSRCLRRLPMPDRARFTHAAYAATYHIHHVERRDDRDAQTSLFLFLFLTVPVPPSVLLVLPGWFVIIILMRCKLISVFVTTPICLLASNFFFWAVLVNGAASYGHLRGTGMPN